MSKKVKEIKLSSGKSLQVEELNEKEYYVFDQENDVQIYIRAEDSIVEHAIVHPAWSEVKIMEDNITKQTIEHPAFSEVRIMDDAMVTLNGISEADIYKIFDPKKEYLVTFEEPGLKKIINKNVIIHNSWEENGGVSYLISDNIVISHPNMTEEQFYENLGIEPF
jgi:hypothetical protein